MAVETRVGLGDERAVEAPRAAADLSPATRSMALRSGSKAKARRHAPSAAAKRISFMFAWREPLSVSTRGRPSCGPVGSSRWATAKISSWTCGCRRRNSGTNSPWNSTAQFMSAECCLRHMKSRTFLTAHKAQVGAPASWERGLPARGQARESGAVSTVRGHRCPRPQEDQAHRTGLRIVRNQEARSGVLSPKRAHGAGRVTHTRQSPEKPGRSPRRRPR